MYQCFSMPPATQNLCRLEITRDQAVLHSIIKQHLKQHILPSASTFFIQMNEHFLLGGASVDEMHI